MAGRRRDQFASEAVLFPHGFLRICAATPRVEVANPFANLEHLCDTLTRAEADIVLLPELCLTGYTCGDLFLTDSLLTAAKEALKQFVSRTRGQHALVVIGLPLVVKDVLMNVAVVVRNGRILGIVPKSYLPTYHEFYESRHFQAAGATDPHHVEIGHQAVPFGTDLLFDWGPAVIGIEICEDLWGPVPPSSLASLAGANVLLNLSSSNETIGKADWRRNLVRVQSGRCLAAYAYASSGAGESTSDLVFGGHSMIAENGRLLGESRRIGDGLVPGYVEAAGVTCDVDLQHLARERRAVGTFADAKAKNQSEYRSISVNGDSHGPLSVTAASVEQAVLSRSDNLDGDLKSQNACDDELAPRNELLRFIDPHPFVPSNVKELDARCSEILAIQVAGLAKRLKRLPQNTTLSIGVSGGLDSTLALIVAVQACDAIGWTRERILALVMPGFGTTEHTRVSAERLVAELGVRLDCVDIRSQCLEAFRAIGHCPFGIELSSSIKMDALQDRLTQLPDDAADLVFENVQARIRTMLLMTRGFVLGTGDMSEQALGWSTYNADHMSMYNVNTSVPKTLVRFLVRHFASRHDGSSLADVLHRIADTPISPELLPPTESGEIRQSTESAVGPYELHDFFLYHFIRHGFSKKKILFLASKAQFDGEYSADFIADTIDVFFKRFFSNQFKRNCVPDGPKIGTVSLSPRGDWRMPSDADSDCF